jgi:DnaK suppressor protein
MPPPTTSPDQNPTAARLIAERAAAAARVETRRAELEGVAGVAMTEGRDDEHDPDGATVAFEQSLAAGLLAQAVAYLTEVDVALERLSAGLHGVCERCGQPIPEARLEARPTARCCVSCATGRRALFPGLD